MTTATSTRSSTCTTSATRSYAPGLTEPVLDVERMTLTYPNVLGLMRDLESHRRTQRHRRTRPRTHGARHVMKQARSGVRAVSTRSGVLPATYEVVYGAAWGTAGKRGHRSSTARCASRRARSVGAAEDRGARERAHPRRVRHGDRYRGRQDRGVDGADPGAGRQAAIKVAGMKPIAAGAPRYSGWAPQRRRPRADGRRERPGDATKPSILTASPSRHRRTSRRQMPGSASKPRQSCRASANWPRGSDLVVVEGAGGWHAPAQ